MGFRALELDSTESFWDFAPFSVWRLSVFRGIGVEVLLFRDDLRGVGVSVAGVFNFFAECGTCLLRLSGATLQRSREHWEKNGLKEHTQMKISIREHWFRSSLYLF